MKNLFAHSPSKSRRNKCRTGNRNLGVEALEIRQLMSATDIAPAFEVLPQSNNITSQRGVMITPDALLQNYVPGAANTLGELGVNLLRVELVNDNVGPVNSPDPASFSRDVAEYRAWLDGELDKIDRVAGQLQRDGIKVIIDMHDPFGGPEWGKSGRHQLFIDAQIRQQFIEDWKHIAHRYCNSDFVVGFDLLNEPNRKVTKDEKKEYADNGLQPPLSSSWNDLVADTIHAIRQVGGLNTNRMIVVESIGGNPLNLKELDPARFKGPVAFSFHFYVPMNFSSYEVDRYFHYRNQYEDDAKDFPMPDAKNERLPSDWKEQIDKVLKAVIDFQQKYNVQIYVGEFSASLINSDLLTRETKGLTVSTQGRKHDVAEYLDYVTDRFESLGWDWTYHAYGESPLWDLWKNFGERDGLWKTAGLKKDWRSNSETPAIQAALDNRVLTITGTDRADNILIYRSGGRIAVNQIGFNNTVTWFDGSVDHITVECGGGNDVVQNATNIPMTARGGAGQDILIGGDGDDILDGGDGEDRLEGRLGNDTLRGGSENDVLIPGPGVKQRVNGGEGNGDKLIRRKGEVAVAKNIEFFGRASTTRILQLSPALQQKVADDSVLTIEADEGVGRYMVIFQGSDVVAYADSTEIYRGPAAEVSGLAFIGSDAADTFVNQTWLPLTASSGEGNDILIGGSGADNLNGDAGNDQLCGGSGDDQLSGGDGDDVLYGGVGNDTINGGAGNDSAWGEAGNDILIGERGQDWLDGGLDNDQIYGGGGNDQLFGSIGDDQIYGGDGDDVMYGGSGNDILNGQAGNDAIFGEDGFDVLYGESGMDWLDGGFGNDTIYGGDGRDRLFGSDGNDILEGEDGHDFLDGGSGDDILRGGIGNDEMYGNAGNDLLRGGDGDDAMFGGSGNDQIYGGAGNNYLDGGDGDDLLNGQTDAWWSRQIRKYRGWIWG